MNCKNCIPIKIGDMIECEKCPEIINELKKKEETMSQKELFNGWKNLGEKIKSAGNIVQNSLDLNPPKTEQIIEWQQNLLEAAEELNKLIDQTHKVLLEKYQENIFKERQDG